MRALVRRHRRAPKTASEVGASAVEYGLMVAAIAAVIVGVVFSLGKIVTIAFSQTCSAISAQTSAQGASCDGTGTGTGTGN